jgi:hypothetical protein
MWCDTYIIDSSFDGITPGPGCHTPSTMQYSMP